MNGSLVGQLRLKNLHVSAPRFNDAAKLAAWMGALQAQDYGAAKRAVALRLKAAPNEATTETIFRGNKLIRAWSLRGTIHVVPPEDAGWMIDLVAARPVASARLVERALGLDEALIAKSTKLIVKTLKGRLLTRPELYAILEKHGFSTKGQRGYHMLWRAGMAGHIAFGPAEGKQPTFSLLTELAPQPRALKREAALAELARRYFQSHAPATVADFIWWSGLAPGDARAAHEAIRSELIEEVIEGKCYRLYAKGSGKPDGGFHLLPGFDEFILGYQDRTAVISAELAPALSPYKNGVFQPVMVSDGRIVGTWSRRINNKGVQVEPKPFDKLKAKDQRSFMAEADLYAKYLGLRLLKIAKPE